MKITIISVVKMLPDRGDGGDAQTSESLCVMEAYRSLRKVTWNTEFIISLFA